MKGEDKLPVLPLRPSRPAPQDTHQTGANAGIGSRVFTPTDDPGGALHVRQPAGAACPARAAAPPAAQQSVVRASALLDEHKTVAPSSLLRPERQAGRDLPQAAKRPPKAGRADVAAGAVAPGFAGNEARDRGATARRITALHLPGFAMERWVRRATARGDALPDDFPVVLATEGPHGPVIHAANRAAALAGAQPGARVVDIRALCPALRVDYADTGADRAALHRLMLWSRRWCPWSAVDGEAGLVLDTTGSDHLWGGEAAMLREIEERLAQAGLSVALAVAPTHGAAWALARFGGVREVCSPDGLAARMAPLPVRALRLTGDTVLLLQRLGLKTVGDLAAVPRISLARRFSRAPLSANPLLRLDQMMGRLPEPVSPPEEPPRFAVESRLAEPVQDPAPHLPALCAELCAGLAAAGYGARRIAVTVYRTDGEISCVEVATAQPVRDPDHIRRLFDGRLEQIDPGFGFDHVTLAATVAETLALVQARLGGKAGDEDAADLSRLIDRLSARFGAAAVRRPVMHETHLPERRETWHPALGTDPRRPAATPPDPAAIDPAIVDPAPATLTRTERPLRLFDHPEEIRVVYAVPEGPPAQFVWRRVTHRVARFAGPERIAPEWWRDRPGTRLRDYYRIEDQTGRRFWIYREGVLGDGRGGAAGHQNQPHWFVHGVFA